MKIMVRYGIFVLTALSLVLAGYLLTRHDAASPKSDFPNVSASSLISARDSETGIAVNATFIVTTRTGEKEYTAKEYSEREINAFAAHASAGEYKVTVKAEGYKEASSSFVVPVTSTRIFLTPLTGAAELDESNSALHTKQNSGLIVGFVVDEDGRPLSGVTVRSATFSAVTNNRGFYVMPARILEQQSCAGVDVAYTKQGYITEKHVHAMSGSILSQPSERGQLNIMLKKGLGEHTTDDVHALCQ